MKRKKIALFAVLTLVVVTFSLLVGCNDDKFDNEKSPFVMAIGELDGVFSPFFSTSAYDGSVAGLTQVAMLDVDKKGFIDYGDELPSVVRYVSENTIDDRSPEEKADNLRNPEKYNTTYKLVLKNGIKFSDGVDLTYKDVLFNIYTYLDPAYNGSSTMYSSDIMGLASYRTQEVGASDETAFSSIINNIAVERLRDFRDYYHVDGEKTGIETDKEILKEYKEALGEFFRKELETDWTSMAAGLEDYSKEYVSVTDGKKLITETWQMFLVMWGAVVINYDETGPDPTKYKSINYAQYTDEIAKFGKNAEAVRDYCIEAVYSIYFGAKDAVNDTAFRSKLNTLLSYTASGSEFFSYISNQIRSERLTSGEKVVSKISGINVYPLAANTEFADNISRKRSYTLEEEHWVLEVVIAGVDPKALMNFGFAVAPMHYYSNPDAHKTGHGFTTAKDGYSAFSLEEGKEHFGLAYASPNYLDKVIKAVSGLPMGAGMYKASNRNRATEISKVTALGANTGFYESNTVYYTRNDYFETTAKSSNIHNTKIKMVRYAVTNSTRLFEAVKTKTVHYADPSAKTETMSELNNPKGDKDLKYVTTPNNGYGYIGINAKYVPDLEIRKAIMHAMDISLVLGYYPNKLAENIYRPMSKESWAYPKEIAEPFYNSNTNGRFDEAKAIRIIEEYVEAAGFKELDSREKCLYKNSPTGKRLLKFTFTVAGADADHPAYSTMQNAANILNKCGFNIKIHNDAWALSKLSTGKLTVWAAAWGSSIDPDMFQVYHKDSKATSITAWGYPSILGINGAEQTGSTGEVDTIGELSELIDEARKITDTDDRTLLYHQALEKIMEIAVELPTYQRSNLYVYRASILDESTILRDDDVSAYMSPLGRMWELSFANN